MLDLSTMPIVVLSVTLSTAENSKLFIFNRLRFLRALHLVEMTSVFIFLLFIPSSTRARRVLLFLSVRRQPSGERTFCT